MACSASAAKHHSQAIEQSLPTAHANAFRELKSLEDFNWSFNPSIKKSEVYELATGRFIEQRRDVLFCREPPGTGKSHLVQGIGYQLIKLGYHVHYRSIFDVVRDLLHDEAMDGHERVMSRYLKPDLLIIDDFGMKQLPKRSGEFLFEIVMRRYETRSHDDDDESTSGRLGQVAGRRSHGDGDPRPLPAPRRDHHLQRARATACATVGSSRFKTSH